LSYLYSNVDDLNEVCDTDFTEDEVAAILKAYEGGEASC
jgi:hypothetical protein